MLPVGKSHNSVFNYPVTARIPTSRGRHEHSEPPVVLGKGRSDARNSFTDVTCEGRRTSGERSGKTAEGRRRRSIWHRAVRVEWSYSSGKAYADPFNDVGAGRGVHGPARARADGPGFLGGRANLADSIFTARRGPLHLPHRRERHKADLHGAAGRAGGLGLLRETTLCGSTAPCASRPTNATSSTRTERLSSGWATRGGWAFATGLRWPEDFQELAADRVKKGFTVIQIIAGLYPDMPPFDPRGANEAGFPWEADYARINPTIL